METRSDATVSLYVHWPFCQAKCPYCDFNSHVVPAVDHEAWKDSLVASIDQYQSLLGKRDLTSIYFGGGTPSLMPASTVEAIIEAATGRWSAAPTIEITLEANPTSVEAARFAGYASAGVNRVSIGVQSLDNDDLRVLGRLHSVDEALHAIELAQSHFPRVSFDLIYARQSQTLDAWRVELKQALSLGTDHLSLYQLTIEPNTAFARRFEAGSLKGLPDEDLSADMYLLTQEMCASAGLDRYEVSNHARKGFESMHNMTYWSGGDWVGVGPGAHGRFTIESQRYATSSERQPHLWLKTDVGDREDVVCVDAVEEAEVRTMMGLRTREGLQLPDDNKSLETIRKLVRDDLLWTTNARYGVTDSGILLLNAILRKLLA